MKSLPWELPASLIGWAAVSWWLHVSLAEIILLAGMWVIVPIGVVVLLRVLRPDQGQPNWFGAYLLTAALVTSVSWTEVTGLFAAAWAVVWLVPTTACALAGLIGLLKGGWRRPSAACFCGAFMLLSVGGVWLVIARGGWRPLGFSDEIVLLTAVHFHFAGFALPLITGWVIGGGTSRRDWLLAICILLGVPLVGVGITLSALAGFVYTVWELLAALLLAAACWWLAVRLAGKAWRLPAGIGRTLLLVAAASLATGMTLAAVYSVGQFSGRGWLKIPAMIPTHGVVNAAGFALCGLVGIQLVTARSNSPRLDGPGDGP